MKETFFCYLVVISYTKSTCKVKTGEDVDYSCPQNSFTTRVIAAFVIKTFADEHLLASNLGIFKFFPSYRFGVAVKEKPIVLETYPSPRR